VRERERETHTHRERGRDIHRDRERETHTHRQRERETHTQTERERNEINRDSQKKRYRERNINRAFHGFWKAKSVYVPVASKNNAQFKSGQN